MLSSFEDFGYDVNGAYGTDTVRLDISTGSTVLDGQVVAGFASEEFDLGFFGLSPVPLSFSSSGGLQRTFFQDLQSTSRIASPAWSYTAGAYKSLSRHLAPITVVLTSAQTTTTALRV